MPISHVISFCMTQPSLKMVWSSVSIDLRLKRHNGHFNSTFYKKECFIQKIRSFQKRENFYVQILGLETVKNTIRDIEIPKLWLVTCTTAAEAFLLPHLGTSRLLRQWLSLPSRHRQGNASARQRSVCNLFLKHGYCLSNWGTLGIFLMSMFFKDLRGSLIFF